MKKISFRGGAIFVVGALLLTTPEIFGGVEQVVHREFFGIFSSLLIVGVFARVLLTFGMPIWGAILASILAYIAAGAIAYFMEYQHSYNKRMEKYQQKTPPISSTVNPLKGMNLTAAPSKAMCGDFNRNLGLKRTCHINS